MPCSFSKQHFENKKPFQVIGKLRIDSKTKFTFRVKALASLVCHNMMNMNDIFQSR